MAEKQSKMAAPPLPHSPNDDGHPYPLADHLEAVAA
jgi:hypothetical protein